MSKVDFEFDPGDYVQVTHLGLNIPGRIIRAFIQRGNVKIYDVETNDEGVLNQRSFFEDELQDCDREKNYVHKPL